MTCGRNEPRVARAKGRRVAVFLVLAAVVLAVSASVAPAQIDGRWQNDPAAGSEDEGPSGRWRKVRQKPEPALTREQAEEIERLSSLGYLAGSQPAPATSGVVTHDASRAQEGLNFFTSGHFAGAVLMDMEGGVIHEWRYDFLQAWPEETESAENDGAEYWRWAHLFENGDVLAIFEGLGLIKVDAGSELLWKHLGGEHHDLEVMDDGLIYALSRKAHMVPDINERMPILEDFVAVLGSDGRLLREVSVLQAFENSVFSGAPAARDVPNRGDIFHTNAIEVLDGSLADRIPAFRKGNVLLSMRQLSMIAVLDMDSEKIVWVSSGLWFEQHDPKVLPNGNILVFDNRGDDGMSRVLEFNPVSGEIVWVYAGSDVDQFFTKMCGASHRLPNGNTLATESDNGRAFEVTPEGEKVWEFLNPHYAGKTENLIATLFDVVRLEPDFPITWSE